MKKIGLVGNPNCGKSALFNTLTGSDARVGNWPGITVERKEGVWQAGNFLLVDLPGVYSLSPYTPEERATLSFLLEEKPDLLIQVVDSTALERSLFLTGQLLELDIPLVVALNMADLAEKKGIKPQADVLADLLGVAVVEISALSGEGREELQRQLLLAEKKGRRGRTILEKDAIWKRMGGDRLKIADADQGLFYAMRRQEQREDVDWEGEIAAARYRFAQMCYEKAVEQCPQSKGCAVDMDRLFLHPVWGIPIFFIIMAFIFHLTFSAGFFGTKIPSPGVFFRQATEQGMYMLRDIVLRALPHLPVWAKAFLAEGIFDGMGRAVSFLPQILCLFFCLSFLEDCGYMARAAFLLDKPMRRLGLSGRAFLPLLTGFGCSVPAMMSVRTLERESTRRITRLIIPFFSCGAKLPLYALLTGLLFPRQAGLIIFCIYFLGIFLALLWAWILQRWRFSEEDAPFIMEIPAYHLPKWANLMRTLTRRAEEYLTKAGTVIFGASVAIWLLSHITTDFRLTAETGQSLLATIGRGISPVFQPLGFGGGADGWKAAAAILSGLAAKEAVVSSLGVLAAGSGVFSPAGAVSFMVFHLCSIPCIAAVTAFWCEEKNGKHLAAALLLWLATAWVMSFFAYRLFVLVGWGS